MTVALTSPPSNTSKLRTRRGIAVTCAVMILLGLLYANFMVPLLDAGLADAPMVTVADPTRMNGVFVAVSYEMFPPGFEWIGYLLVLATMSLGPLIAVAGLLVSSWVAIAEFRVRHLLPAVVSTLTCLGFLIVLVLSQSPWGRTAKAWFFD